MKEELISVRRQLHKGAETGFCLTNTVKLVKERLTAYGILPKDCGRAGVTATIGKSGGRIFLLRADMDGLPIAEKSGVGFAAQNGNMHACGHDMHTAMLLGAAKLLKEKEKELKGQVKFLFQPAEELLEGATDMIEKGALSPLPDGAMTLHVMTAVDIPVGGVLLPPSGVGAPAADFFTVRVQGKGCHGSTPWKGVDALTVGARILLALQEITARELPIATPAVLTVGSVKASEGSNVISDFATLQGTLRSFDEGARSFAKKRLEEISKGIAKSFRARASVVYEGGCPTLVNDGELTAFALRSLQETFGAQGAISLSDGESDVRKNSGGSEDFAYISQKIPSVMVAIPAGERKKGYEYPLHHPKVQFDEEALPVGAAAYAKVAWDFLQSK